MALHKKTIFWLLRLGLGLIIIYMVFGRQEVLNGVWGDEGKDTSLRFYIWQLRKKLAEAASIEILNLKGMGYLLKVYSKGNEG